VCVCVIVYFIITYFRDILYNLFFKLLHTESLHIITILVQTYTNYITSLISEQESKRVHRLTYKIYYFFFQTIQ